MKYEYVYIGSVLPGYYAELAASPQITDGISRKCVIEHERKVWSPVMKAAGTRSMRPREHDTIAATVDW